MNTKVVMAIVYGGLFIMFMGIMGASLMGGDAEVLEIVRKEYPIIECEYCGEHYLYDEEDGREYNEYICQHCEVEEEIERCEECLTFVTPNFFDYDDNICIHCAEKEFIDRYDEDTAYDQWKDAQLEEN